MTATLLAWGALAHRVGEARTVALGLGGSAVALTAAAFAPDPATPGLAQQPRRYWSVWSTSSARLRGSLQEPRQTAADVGSRTPSRHLPRC
ncbi:MAG: hypothetical protein ACK4WC_09450 [Rubrimonas sp.]